MHMDTVDAVMRAFERYMQTRDLNGLVSLYESDALFVPEPGVRLLGHDQIRQAFTELLGIDPALELTSTKILESSDLALASNEWTLRGKAAGRSARVRARAKHGSAIERSGQSRVVLRRDGERGFRIVIDQLAD
jgi:uncharacterized protein (TIGR02246 family)